MVSDASDHDAGISLRTASPGHAATLREIYRPYVENTAISFELEVPTSRNLHGASVPRCRPGRGSSPRSTGNRSAMRMEPRTVPDKPIVIRWRPPPTCTRAIIGEASRVACTNGSSTSFVNGISNAYAGITLPNDASAGFHRSLGFEPIVVFPRIGRKFGRWHDVAWLHLPLRDSVLD